MSQVLDEEKDSQLIQEPVSKIGGALGSKIGGLKGPSTGLKKPEAKPTA